MICGDPLVKVEPNCSGVMPVLDSTESPGSSGCSSSPARRAPQRVHLYTAEILDMWNMERIITELGTENLCIAFTEEQGLIPTSKKCRIHRSSMKIINSGGQLGKFACKSGHCKKRFVSRAKGTWFENAKLPLPIIFKLMYCYAQDYNYMQAKLECSSRIRGTAVSESTICDWYTYCRETIVAYEIENQLEKSKIGGPGIDVLVEESKFGKHKYYKGRKIEGHWLLSMVDDKTNELRLEVCPINERSENAIIPIIKQHVNEGSIIHTNCWRAYDCLSAHGYIHKRENQSNPEISIKVEDETHPQHIESKWKHLKKRFHKINYKENFEDWLIEYLWRLRVTKNHEDPFKELIKCVKYVFKVK